MHGIQVAKKKIVDLPGAFTEILAALTLGPRVQLLRENPRRVKLEVL